MNPLPSFQEGRMPSPERSFTLRLKPISSASVSRRHKLPIFAIAVAGFIGLTCHTDKAASEEAPRPGKTLRVGDQIELSQYALACRDLGVLEKGFVLIQQKDLHATNEYFSGKTLSGECQTMPPATKVVVQDSRGTSFVCIRKADEPDCYWAVRYTVEPADKPSDSLK
jgi:hypothetical protein